MEGGGLVGREPSRHSSRIIGVLMVLALIPALLMFVGRHSIVGGSRVSADSDDRSSTSTIDVGPTGVTSTGTGTCTVEESGVLIDGPGMTSCRTQEWASNRPAEPRFSAVIDGIDAGATAIIRLREDAGDRIEVAIGRSTVVVRQLDDGVWSFISTTERPPRVVMAPDRIVIAIEGRNISVVLDDRFVSSGVTSVVESGSVSVGAVLSDGVAVRFASVDLSDAA